MLYFITRLPNPHYSPEQQAKTTLVDFTVTQKGLEEQLLGKVIGREAAAVEKLLQQVLAEVNVSSPQRTGSRHTAHARARACGPPL